MTMDPTQIKYRLGHPFHFIAIRPFTLSTTGVAISKGTDVLFDGTKAEIEGAEYTVPQLRGAVKAGWIVLAEDYNANRAVLPISANIQVRHPTQGGNPMDRQRMPTTVSEEERVVGGTISQHAQQTRSGNTGYVRGQTRVNATPRGVQAGQVVHTQRGMMVVEQQDGTVVDRAPLQTPAGDRAKYMRTSAEYTGEVLSDISKIRIEPGAGVSREELLERMSEQEQEQYLSEIESRKAAYVNEEPAAARPVASSRQVVGRVNSGAAREGQREGMSFKNSVGAGSIEIEDPTGLGGKAHESETEVEGIKFKFVNGPKRDNKPSVHPRSEEVREVRAPGSIDARRMVAKTMCADFPDLYDFTQPARKKLARITADFEDRPDIIRAIFAAEGDDFKMMLVEAFPSVFESAA